MAEYLIQDTTLVALADEVRILADSSDAMSPSVMTSTLTAENTNFATNLSTQNDLIAQIQTALQGKAAGGATDTTNEDALVMGTVSGNYANSRVTNIKRYAFEGCTDLNTVDFAVCSYIGSHAFDGCTNLTTVAFSVCQSIYNDAFNGCSNLGPELDFPECYYIGASAFAGCSSITSITLGNLNITELASTSGFGDDAFSGCIELNRLMLNYGAVISSPSAHSFDGTPIGEGTGYIFVPATLYDAYNADEGWSNFSQWLAVES